MNILERALKQELNIARYTIINADDPHNSEAIARAAINRPGWEQTKPAVQSAIERLATLQPRRCSDCRSPLEEWEQSQCEGCARLGPHWLAVTPQPNISQNRKKV